MKVICYPADNYGCGHHRIIWPAQVLQQQGVDVEVVQTGDRHVKMRFQDGQLADCDIAPDVDVVVLQRTTDWRLVELVKHLRSRGVAVVVDVDDDLSAIHPSNPAFAMLDPNRAKHETQQLLRAGKIKEADADRAYSFLKTQYPHSWLHLNEACRHATLVTVSTPGLLRRYAGHGRGHLLTNCAPDHYLEIEHVDNDVIGWPASLHSHPNDPPALGNALARLVDDGCTFTTIGHNPGARDAFGLAVEPSGDGDVTLERWPYELAKLGIGIAPLADTLFNSRKSWLKPLELSACGVPWVASPRAAYRELHQVHGIGLLADKPRQWYQALRRLVDEPALRQEMSEAGRTVARELSVSANAWRWAEAWQRALELERASVAV